MIIIKNKASIAKMEEAGRRLAEIFDCLALVLVPGVSTLEIDTLISKELISRELVSKTKGYMGYQHVSCISLNDEVVHGVPAKTTIIKVGDLVKIDICASYNGYCADMARSFFVGGELDDKVRKFVSVAQRALNKGIEKAVAGNHLSDISAAIQNEVERHGFSVIRDFAGHGIGKAMHEEPEILNYGKPGLGPVLRPGMTLALEPMITMGGYSVYVASDGWTVKTVDKSWAAHVEDTVLITEGKPKILTRNRCAEC